MEKKFFLVSVIVGFLYLFFTFTLVSIPGAGKTTLSAADINELNLNAKINKNQPATAVKPDLNFGRFPLYFISNKGQINKKARFYAKASRYTLWLTKEGLVFDSCTRTETGKDSSGNPLPGGVAEGRGGLEPFKLSRSVSRLMFIGANKNPEMSPIKKTKLKVNYFKGNDRSKWHCDVPTSMAVLYKNLYKNIDLKVYGIEKIIEYDWIVKPGGNPIDIRFEYKNTKGTYIDDKGDLIIETEFGELIHKKPVSYQEIKAEGTETLRQEGNKVKRQMVVVKFKKIGKDTYGFAVGDYDRSRELVIDPVVLAYSTYLGGSYWDYGNGIVVDSSGNVYVSGRTNSTDFPTLNQYQTDPDSSSHDVFIFKIDTTKNGYESLIYSTYLGGGDRDGGIGIAVDSSGCAYVTGYTDSSDFPILNQYQSYQESSDAFVTKLDTNLSGAACLIYSTYLGGGDGDGGNGIAVDSSGCVFVTGYTYSSDFPILNQYQGNQAGKDAFVTKLNTNLSGAACLIYSTYLGGGDIDSGYGIAVDSSGHAFVTGYTDSSDFPILNQYQGNQAGKDAFVTKLNTNLSGAACLIYSTYLGGSNSDSCKGIVLDDSGNVYVTGYTYSSDFPTLNQYQSYQGSSDAFVIKLDINLSGADCLIYSTYLGGSNYEIGYGIAVDGSENVYVTGITESEDFPVLHHYQGTYQGGYRDAFVSKIDTTAGGTAGLIYSTYLGGGSWDEGNGITVDWSGSVYVCGNTKSGNFPTLHPYHEKQLKYDVFVTKLMFASITVTSPDGGEAWGIGTQQDITWDSEGMPDNLAIVLVQNGIRAAVIAKNIDPAAGSYSWTVGDCLSGTVSPGANYKILIGEKVSKVKDSSDAPFTITPPAVTVTSPNGGEDWTIGSNYEITWTAPGVSNNLYIVLRQNGVNVALIAKGINPAPGSYNWTVGDCLKGTVTPGTNYRIVIIDSSMTIRDKSDGSFTISSE